MPCDDCAGVLTDYLTTHRNARQLREVIMGLDARLEVLSAQVAHLCNAMDHVQLGLDHHDHELDVLRETVVAVQQEHGLLTPRAPRS